MNRTHSNCKHSNPETFVTLFCKKHKMSVSNMENPPYCSDHEFNINTCSQCQRILKIADTHYCCANPPVIITVQVPEKTNIILNGTRPQVDPTDPACKEFKFK